MTKKDPSISPLPGYAKSTRHPDTDPPDVGATAPGPLRDRSAKQPLLPVEKTTWDNWRFMLRARRVRVKGPNKTHVKLFYLALASMTDQVLKGVDVGKFALPLHVLLFDLQLSRNTFYKLRRQLRGVGLLDWKQQRNRSTEYRVFTQRDWAKLPPGFLNPRIPTIGTHEYQWLRPYVGTSGGAPVSRGAPSHSSNGVVRRKGTGSAPRLKAVTLPPTVEEVLNTPSRGEPGPNEQKFKAELAKWIKPRKRRRNARGTE